MNQKVLGALLHCWWRLLSARPLARPPRVGPGPQNGHKSQQRRCRQPPHASWGRGEALGVDSWGPDSQYYCGENYCVCSLAYAQRRTAKQCTKYSTVLRDAVNGRNETRSMWKLRSMVMRCKRDIQSLKLLVLFSRFNARLTRSCILCTSSAIVAS